MNSKEETDTLVKGIQRKYGKELEAHIHSLMKPRLIIMNVPDDTTSSTENSILRQNPEVSLREGSITAKFVCDTKKKNRNAVVEVSADTRMTLLNNKIKLGWQICRIDDYITATNCYKCSNYNHRTQDCKGEVTCLICAGKHTLKEFKCGENNIKCINC
jgi:hypothetical protein